MNVLKAAAAALLFAGTALPVFAQPAAHALNLSRDEQGAIAALQAAAAGPDRAAQDAALAAARAAARSADARYAVAYFQLEIGRARGDRQMFTTRRSTRSSTAASRRPTSSPRCSPTRLSRAYSGGDMARTERLLARIVEVQPNNAEALADYGQFKSRINSRATAAADRTLAVQLFGRALAANQAAGRASSESLHRRALAVAFDGTRPPLGLTQLAPQAIGFARALVAAYPSQVNWRDALLVYRDLAAADPALDLDIRRLQRATQSLAGERDYLDFAQTLDRAGFPGEANAAFDEGVSRGMLDTAKPAIAQAAAAINRRVAADRAGARPAARARAAPPARPRSRRAPPPTPISRYGQYAEAAALYSAALLKGGEDRNLVNSRLGASLALAGRRPEAEAALRAVTGPRADLAGFWLVWLARRPA